MSRITSQSSSSADSNSDSPIAASALNQNDNAFIDGSSISIPVVLNVESATSVESAIADSTASPIEINLVKSENDQEVSDVNEVNKVLEKIEIEYSIPSNLSTPLGVGDASVLKDSNSPSCLPVCSDNSFQLVEHAEVEIDKSIYLNATAMEDVNYNIDNNCVLAVVTGATGYIGSYITLKLLDRGYKVRGTVRNLENQALYAHLLENKYAKDNLELLNADLLDAEVWDSVVADADYVFHCASPYKLEFTDPYKDIINPAIEGTKNVLNACCNSKSLKKIILTSSVAAIAGSYTEGKVYSEADWNEASSANNEPYLFSKSQAEKLAHRIVRERIPHIPLVCVNPGMVVGPSHRSDLNQSVVLVKDILTAAYPILLDFTTCWVDVRDVAEIHIRLMESSTSDGRYICIQNTYTYQEIGKIIKKSFPHFRVPTKVLPTCIAKALLQWVLPKGSASTVKQMIGRSVAFSNGKLKAEIKDYKFIPINVSIAETCYDIILKQNVKPNPYKIAF